MSTVTIAQMKDLLIKWNPRWNLSTINKWSNNQIIAIYSKQLIKQQHPINCFTYNKQHIKNEIIKKYKQISFF